MIRYLVVGALLFAWPHNPVLAQDANRDEVYTRADAGSIIDSLDRRTGEFKEEFDRAIGHSLLDGTKLEERARHRADDLHDSAKKLRDVYHEKRDKNNPAVRELVDRTLAAAADVNHIMTDHRFTDKLQRDWDLLRSDSNALAKIYDLTPL